MSRLLSLSLAAALVATAPLHAQTRSTVTSSALDAVVTARPTTDRARVTSALMSPSALAVAATMGLSPDAVSTRINALDDAGARKVADQVLAGGDQMIVLSTTAVIIALLLIILLTR